MARKTPKTQYVVAVTRGRKTRYSWGEKLKDALAHANLRMGEAFVFTKLVGGPETKAEFHGGSYAEVA